MKKAITTLLSLLVVGGLLAACGGTPAPEGAATEPPAAGEKIIKVGLEAPFTGPNALTGQEMKNGAEMALEAVNYTVGDYKIELVTIDDQSDPQKGVQAYEEAVVGQGIIAGLLGWHSSVAVAQMEVAARHKIPHFFHMGAASTVNEKWKSDQATYGYWTTKGWPVGPSLTVGYIQALEEAIAAGTFSPADKTVAIYGEDTDWGRDVGAGLRQQFEGAGWTVVSEDYFTMEQTDFQALLNRYKDEDVAVIAGTDSIPASISGLVKQADEIGLKSVVIADGLGWIGSWYDLTGPSSNYVLDMIPEFASAEAQKFATDYQAKFNLEPSPSAAGLSYDWTNFFILIAQTALQDSGEITSASLYKVAQDKLWTGQLTYTAGIIMPELKFAAESVPDPVTGKGFFTFPIRQYHEGTGVLIWPDDVKTGTFEVKP